VAAHSTVRALYAAYDGPLYNVTRGFDNRSTNVSVLNAGGFANITAHDAFCNVHYDCVISNVFDQSPQGNHLHGRHKLVNASQHKIIVGNGTNVYGMWFDPGYGYHTDDTRGIATGNDPESIYAVMSGTHYNGKCCFDYGNSETDDTSDGAGTMEAIYFGNAHWQKNTGDNSTSDGPWVGADLECGMYYGGGNETKTNPQSKALPFPFVSLYLRGGTNGFVLKGADATHGALMTMYDGARPDCAIAGTCNRHVPPGHANRTYQPMDKKGAIILATGGDNSNGAQGKFYEGYMVTGVTSDATDAAVQANIVAVKYQNLPPPPPPTLLGCYVDKPDGHRDLPVCATKEMRSSNALDECGSLCSSYAYFALENGHECRCGNAYGKHGKSPRPAADCSMPCTHDPAVMCGGKYFESVYAHNPAQ
jgi:hypothetical protein